MPIDHDRTLTFPPLDAEGRAFGLLALRTDSGNAVVPAVGRIDVPGGAYVVLTLGLETVDPKTGDLVSVIKPGRETLASIEPGSVDMLQWFEMTGSDVGHLASLEGISALTLDGDLGGEAIAAAARFDLERLAVKVSTLDGQRLAPLETLARLDSLVFEGPLVEEDFATLARLPSLSSLMLRGTEISASGLQHLSALPLTTLRLLGVDMQPRSFGAFSAFTSLNDLVLQSAAFTTADLETLSGLQHLRNLELYQTSLTVEDLLSGLTSGFAELQSISVNPGFDDVDCLRMVLARSGLSVNGQQYSPKAARKLAAAKGIELPG